MCGRYRLKSPEAAFKWIEVIDQFNFVPRFNIAPTQRVPVVTVGRTLEAMTWGIVPKRAGETSKALINARSETIREKRSFKAAFAERRCLMPADGFYEWRRVDKRPYLFTVGASEPFAIGAVWEAAEDARRCCLLTTAGNVVLTPIHHRMPVIVRREDWPAWLAPEPLQEDAFERITRPYPAEELEARAVSSIVNSPKVDDVRCNEPFDVTAGPVAQRLTLQKAKLRPSGQRELRF